METSPRPTPSTNAIYLQNGSYVFAILAQIAGLVVGFIAIAHDDTPSDLHTLLVLDVVVQIVEGTWYISVGVLYLLTSLELKVSYRYSDWAVTTPIQLVCLYYFALFELDHCKPIEFGASENVLAVCVIVIMDWLMLLVGFVYEIEWTYVTKILDIGAADGFGLTWGFFALFAAVTPVGIATVDASDPEATSLFLITFLLWMIYGLVALAFPGTKNAMIRSTAYSLLDLVSKNGVGIAYALWAIYWEEDTCAASA